MKNVKIMIPVIAESEKEGLNSQERRLEFYLIRVYELWAHALSADVLV
jgi:hypothetical protein